MQIDEIINLIHPLPEASKLKLLEIVTEVSFPKGYILLKAGKIEPVIYLVKKGIVRAYATHETNEITFWFGKEGAAVLSMSSYVDGKEGYEDIELLEHCELYKLSIDKLQKLFNEDIHIANWGRKLAEQELIKTEERLISRQFRTAIERYETLIKENRDLIKRVQLGHIASYLGITQVSLSRIRAEKR